MLNPKSIIAYQNPKTAKMMGYQTKRSDFMLKIFILSITLSGLSSTPLAQTTPNPTQTLKEGMDVIETTSQATVQNQRFPDHWRHVRKGKGTTTPTDDRLQRNQVNVQKMIAQAARRKLNERDNTIPQPSPSPRFHHHPHHHQPQHKRQDDKIATIDDDLDEPKEDSINFLSIPKQTKDLNFSTEKKTPSIVHPPQKPDHSTDNL